MTDQINRGLFTSGTDEWATPESFMEVVRMFWPRFDLDVCALPSSAKAERYFTPEDDGLSQDWVGPVIWMNPPYGRGIGSWVEKAAKFGTQPGNTAVCLLPVRSDTAWWHKWVMGHARTVWMIEGRLHFGGGHERTAHNAPFPSAVVTYDGRWLDPPMLKSLPRRLTD